MSAPRDFLDSLHDIEEAIAKIQQFTVGLRREDFESDDKTTYAVVRAFEIIGEAARRIPESIRSANPSVPWREMMAMRNVLIHDYTGVSLAVVWKTIEEDLPQLKERVSQMIQQHSDSDPS